MQLRDVDVIASNLRFPEGPIALSDGSVIVVEIAAGALSRVHPDGSVDLIADCGGGPNGAAIGPDGAVYLCNNGGLEDPYSLGSIQRVDLARGTVETLYAECGGHHLVAPNDLVFDAAGGFWFTDSGVVQDRVYVCGGVYYAQPDGSEIHEMIYPVDHPNGIGLSADGGRLYFSETMTGRLFWRPLAAPGVIAPEAQRLKRFDSRYLLCGLSGFQLLDSLGVDPAGNVAVATCMSSRITVVAADGSWIRQLAFPDELFDRYLTNICFGGADNKTAFVTMSGRGRLVTFEWPDLS